jgi:hypothetical protein
VDTLRPNALNNRKPWALSMRKLLFKKYVKEVSISGRKMDAPIDTGSDISLMRAEQYVRVGTPKLGKKTIRFRGIGTDYNTCNETLTSLIRS